MGKASLTIAISGTYNGRAIARAEEDMRRLKISAASEAGGIAGSLADAGAAAAEMGGQIHNAGYKIEQAGQSLNVVSAAAIAAGGAAMMAAGDYDAAATKIQTSLGTTAEEAERFRDIGATIYEAGWGQSLDEVTNALLQTKETIRDIDDQGLSTVTKNALVFSQAMGADVNETIRGTNALMEGFGLSAQEASDLMAAGMQRGLNYTDELGDNLAEYSVRWGEAGTSASEYFSLLEAGAANGAYNLDKVGDFLNEFLTSLSDGRMDENIGRLSEGTQEVFESWKEGGATAEDVLNAVVGEMAGMEDAAERASIASDLWSSLGEDNAMGMVLSLANVEDSYANVAGAAEEAAQASEQGFFQRIQSSLRTIQGAAAEVADPFLDSFEEIADAVKDAADWFDGLSDGTKGMIADAVMIAAVAGPAATGIGKITQGVGNLVTIAGKGLQTVSTLGVDIDSTGKKSVSAAKGVGKLGTALGAIGKATGVGVIIAGLGTMLGSIVGDLASAADHAELLSDATDGLAESTTAAEEAYAKASQGIAASSSGYDVTTESVRDLLQAQADLAQQATDTWTDYGTNAALLDGYVATMQELSGQANLSAEDQARLADAVNNFNEITGASISVIDPTTGALSEQADAIIAVKDAYLEQAKAAAASDLLQDSLKQQMQTSRDLEQAKADLAGMEEGLMVKWGDVTVMCDEAGEAYEAQKQKVEDLEAANESISDSVDYYNQLVGESADAMNSTQSALDAYVSGNEALSSALESTGVSADTFTSALSQVGVSTTDLNTLTGEQLSALVSSYDGSLSSITGKLFEFGIQCSVEGTQAGANFASGLSSQAQNALYAASLVTGYTVDELASMAAEAGYKGSDGVIQYANGIRNEAISAKYASQEVVSMADSGLSGGNSYGLGQDYGMGYAQGIASNAVKAAVSAGTSSLVAATSSSLQAAQRSGSPSKVAMGYGEDYGEGYGIGIGDSGKYASQGAASLVKSANDGLSSAEYRYPQAYSTGASNARASGQSHDEVIVLIERLINEVSALRSELGPTIASYTPSLTERQAKRKVQEWTR